MFQNLKHHIREYRLAAIAMVTASTLVFPVSAQQPAGKSGRLIKPLTPSIVVSAVPGSPKASGKALLTALKAARVSDDLGKSQDVSLRLEPGVYDIGRASLRMLAGVDVEGSGIDETEIVGFGQAFNDPNFSFAKGVVVGADGTELRNLTVRCVNTSTLDTCVAMANNQASPRLTHVRLVATSPDGGHWGLRNSDSSPILTDVEIVVANGLKNYGLVNDLPGSQPQLRHTTIMAADASDENVGILNKQKGLPALLNDVDIAAMNGRRAVGILTLDLGDYALARPKNAELPTLSLTNVEVAALDAERNFGLWQGAYALRMRHSRVISDDTAIDVGFLGDVDVASSQLRASEIFVQGENVRIAGSTLLGGGRVIASGELSCTGIRTEAGIADSCP